MHFHTRNSISGNYIKGEFHIWAIKRIIIKVFTAVKNDLIVYVLHFLRSRLDMDFTFRTQANTEISHPLGIPSTTPTYTNHLPSIRNPMSTIYFFIYYIYVHKSCTRWARIEPSAPSVLYGQRLRITQVEPTCRHTICSWIVWVRCGLGSTKETCFVNITVWVSAR